jgi:hypothetical protein
VVRSVLWSNNHCRTGIDHESETGYLEGMLCLDFDHSGVLFTLANGKLIENMIPQ